MAAGARAARPVFGTGPRWSLLHSHGLPLTGAIHVAPAKPKCAPLEFHFIRGFMPM